MNLTRTGSGTVTSSPDGITCGSTCQGTFALGTQVTLTAAPAAGWRFKRWGGGCTGSEGTVCRITISQNRTATVYFEPISQATAALNLTRTGSGTATSSPGGIACGSTCQGTFALGTQVTLTAIPAPGWRFHKWGGGCTAGATDNVCRITISQERNATVYFQEEGGPPRSAALFFHRADGPDTHSIVRNSGTPVTFAWRTENLPVGTTCRIQRLPNHDYKKTVSPITGGTVTDNAIHTWASGDRKFYLWCSDGTNSPEITLTIHPSSATHILTVQTSGSGRGNVFSDPPGIYGFYCRSGCSAVFAAGSTVTLTLSVDDRHSVFTGWTGACSGTAPVCTVTMDSNRSVGANFTILEHEVQAISAGGTHTCALTVVGGVWCWGTAFDYDYPEDIVPVPRPEPVYGLDTGVQAISAGGFHVCALTEEGAVLCWGSNASGQLGGHGLWWHDDPVAVPDLTSGVMAISAGHDHTCALMAEGTVRCWGSNHSGSLGDGSTEVRHGPVAVANLGGVHSISAGYAHTCAVDTHGQVLCWGNNRYGQLGDGSTEDRYLPVVVPDQGGSTRARAISAGAFHTCALTRSGAVRCWGLNDKGQLGTGSSQNSPLPMTVSGLSQVQAISAGFHHTCALSTAGAVQCWGSNLHGQLGDGGNLDHHQPGAVSGLATGVRAIDAGGYHTCALTAAGASRCWGYNRYGQIGDDSAENRLTPVPVIGMGGSSPPSLLENPTLIPFSSQYVFSPIVVEGRIGHAGQVTVDYRVIHLQPSHVEVYVISPDGTVYFMNNRNDVPNVSGSHTFDAGSQPADGLWRLMVRDLIHDEWTNIPGYIDRWSIRF